MVENAILYAGIEELNTIKEHVLELNGYQEQNAELEKEEVRLQKLVTGKEKDLADEIETTLKKRKQELVSSYDSQQNKLNARVKKIRGQKEKVKGTKVTERISEETAELRDANKAIQIDIKALLKKTKTPGICNSTLFFSFFMPKAPVEFLILILGVLIAFLVIPFGAYLLLFAETSGAFALAIIYVITVVLFGGGYLVLNNRLKERHLETLKEIKELRHQYRKNVKEMKGIKKGIRNDSDESTYGLEQYDSELEETLEEIRRIAEEEKEALNTFETVTTAELTNEIKGRYQDELESLRTSLETTSAEQKKAEDRVKEIALMLSKQYETYLGKDNLTIAKLDRLIDRIEKGEATTIGEALALENNK